MTWDYFYLRYYRRYAGWLPVQFCMTCGHAYWGGLPRWWIVRGHGLTAEIGQTWQAAWKDYCSQKCCDNDPSVPPTL